VRGGVVAAPNSSGLASAGAVQHPDVSYFFIHVDVDDLLHAPFVWQALGPEGIDFVYGRGLAGASLERRLEILKQKIAIAAAQGLNRPIAIGINNSSSLVFISESVVGPISIMNGTERCPAPKSGRFTVSVHRERPLQRQPVQRRYVSIRALAITRGDAAAPFRLHFQDKFLKRVCRCPLHRCRCFLWSPMAMASIQWNWPAHAAVVADRARQRALLTVMDPDFIVGAVCDQHVFLLRGHAKSEIVNRSAHAKSCVLPGPPHSGPRAGVEGMHEETAYKFALAW